MSTVVTISASYGAGGSWVGPEVAERLGCQFIDRAIPVQVAERLDVPVEHAQVHDEAAAPRFTRLLARLPNTSGVVVPEPTTDAFCRETERLLMRRGGRRATSSCSGAPPRSCCATGRARSTCASTGPTRRACSRRCAWKQIDEDEARRRQRNSDRARIDYVKHFYRADPRDPRHYHLVLNSTAVALATCVELIVTAARAL